MRAEIHASAWAAASGGGGEKRREEKRSEEERRGEERSSEYQRGRMPRRPGRLLRLLGAEGHISCVIICNASRKLQKRRLRQGRGGHPKGSD